MQVSLLKHFWESSSIFWICLFGTSHLWNRLYIRSNNRGEGGGITNCRLKSRPFIHWNFCLKTSFVKSVLTGEPLLSTFVRNSIIVDSQIEAGKAVFISNGSHKIIVRFALLFRRFPNFKFIPYTYFVSEDQCGRQRGRKMEPAGKDKYFFKVRKPKEFVKNPKFSVSSIAKSALHWSVICCCWALIYSVSRRRASLDCRPMTPHILYKSCTK